MLQVEGLRVIPFLYCPATKAFLAPPTIKVSPYIPPLLRGVRGALDVVPQNSNGMKL